MRRGKRRRCTPSARSAVLTKKPSISAFRAARNFAPERKSNDNVYKALGAHAETLRREGRHVVLASYTLGARDRLRGLLEEQGIGPLEEVENWPAATGASPDRIALAVLPIDHGFTTDDSALISEQDLLGDRLVRRAKRARRADAFMDQLAMMTPGDLVVHEEHGIGRYEGLTAIDVGGQPHDCVSLTYAGDDRLFVPVENMDVLSRYGAGEDLVLDRMGGANWQARKARAKERIGEIAAELIRTAAERATREGDRLTGRAVAAGAASSTGFPMRRRRISRTRSTTR